MSNYLFLLPLSLALGLIGLLTFLWTLKQSQYDDLDGARYRILDEDDYPIMGNPEEQQGVCSQEYSNQVENI